MCPCARKGEGEGGGVGAGGRARARARERESLNVCLPDSELVAPWALHSMSRHQRVHALASLATQQARAAQSSPCQYSPRRISVPLIAATADAMQTSGTWAQGWSCQVRQRRRLQCRGSVRCQAAAPAASSSMRQLRTYPATPRIAWRRRGAATTSPSPPSRAQFRCRRRLRLRMDTDHGMQRPVVEQVPRRVRRRHHRRPRRRQVQAGRA